MAVPRRGSFLLHDFLVDFYGYEQDVEHSLLDDRVRVVLNIKGAVIAVRIVEQI